MKRRTFLEQASKCIIGGIAAAYAGIPADADAAAGSRPNIVVIVADDTGWRDVGYHGSEIRTPNIDMLAKRGVELDQFYVYPTCSPTRAGLMTGRPPSRFGINGPLQYKGNRGLPEDTVTIAELLKRNGYDTAISGKWHLGMEEKFRPGRYGFNHTYGYVGPWIDSYTHDTTDFTESMEPIRQWIRDDELIDEDGHVTDLITNEAIQFIKGKRDRDKPFFLYIPYSSPHVPCQEELEWVHPYDDVIENTSRKYFAAAMTHMDDCIGKVIKALEDERLDKNTLVVFTSDNGGQKGGEYERWLIPPGRYYMSYGATDVLGDNTPLKDWKGSVYEGGIRVPAFMYWPGRLTPAKCDNPMYVCDIYPTLAAIASADIPATEKVEGIDVMPLVSGGKKAIERKLYWHTNWQTAYREGDWKLIHKGRTLEEGSDELYNIASDPNESTNLAESRGDIVTRLKPALAENFRMDK